MPIVGTAYIAYNPFALVIFQGLPVVAVGVGLSTYDKASVRCLEFTPLLLLLQAVNTS